MKTILILGASGQLGNELQIAFNNQAEKFRLLSPSSKSLNIKDKEALQVFFEQNTVDIVINSAAYTAVDKAESASEENNQINNIAVKNIAFLCEQNRAFLFHISTDFVFDGRSNKAYTESDKTNPIQAYGLAKLKGERWVKNGIVIRTSWLYSAFGHNFVKTMLALGKEKETLNVVDNQIGTPCYAADLAQTIFTVIADNNYEKNTGIYHYSNEGVASWYDFANAIMEYANLDCKVRPIPDSKYPTPAQRPLYSVLDKSKIKKAFNIEIPYWRYSLKKCIKLINE